MKRANDCLRGTNVGARSWIGLTFDANYKLGGFSVTVCALVNTYTIR